MNILYLVFGNNVSYHQEVYLSILSIKKQMDNNDNIYVITTNPEFYKRLTFVIVVPITQETIDEWSGEYKFFWRAKIKAMEYMAANYPNQHLMYLDGDTFLRGDLNQIRIQLDESKGMMHLDEGHPSRMKTKTLRMWNTINGRTYAGVTIGLKHNMWNAGVVAIPQNHLQIVVKMALDICDGMLADGAEKVVIEQYSLSIALYENMKMETASKWITHYWANKESWNTLITQFMLMSYTTGRDVEQEVEALDSLRLETIPSYVKKSNTKKRLIRLLDKIFPDKVLS